MQHLTTSPVSWERVVYLERSAVSRGCGALVTFVGMVRGDWQGSRQVRALFYDAYAEMAERQVERLVAEARARWSLEAAVVQHRLGVVEVGGISVIVVVAAQHRAEAYAASQFLLERIKHEVPIWKREQYDDGVSQWTMQTQEILAVAEPSAAAPARCDTPSPARMVPARSGAAHAHV